MKVTIDVIPHQKQRYDTVGDWEIHGDHIFVRVSDMGDWKKEMSVAFHELAEALICLSDGVDETRVNQFDMAYECNRQLFKAHSVDDNHRWKASCGCWHGVLDEPGDDTHAPYYSQHQVATGFERILLNELGVGWQDYEDAINALDYYEPNEPKEDDASY